jgi:hypothetical protein
MSLNEVQPGVNTTCQRDRLYQEHLSFKEQLPIEATNPFENDLYGNDISRKHVF